MCGPLGGQAGVAWMLSGGLGVSQYSSAVEDFERLLAIDPVNKEGIKALSRAMEQAKQFSTHGQTKKKPPKADQVRQPSSAHRQGQQGGGGRRGEAEAEGASLSWWWP